jgi:protocatechuate 3,4-dioxygenase beta subunit
MSLAVLTVVVASLMAPQRLPGQPGEPDARVAGQVIDALSRAPLPGATVVLTPIGPGLPPPVAYMPQAVTDANGQFVFQRLFSGRYRLQAQKPGFAPLTGRFEERTMDIAAGQSITGLELALQTGAVIAGRVVEASGRPLSGLTVSALRQAAGPDGRTIATTSQMAQTNGAGEFRIASLPEGNYVVIAAPMPRPPFAPTVSETVLAPTYYPGTPDKDAAQVIAVGSAQTVSGLQFSMVSLPAHQVSGVLVDEAGSPLAGAIVMLMIDPKKGGPPTPATGQTDENGRFKIGGIVPGTYRVMTGMSSLPPGPPVQGGFRVAVPVGVTGGIFVGGRDTGLSPTPPAIAPLEITVENADITELRIVVSTGK